MLAQSRLHPSSKRHDKAAIACRQELGRLCQTYTPALLIRLSIYKALVRTDFELCSRGFAVDYSYNNSLIMRPYMDAVTRRIFLPVRLLQRPSLHTVA